MSLFKCLKSLNNGNSTKNDIYIKSTTSSTIECELIENEITYVKNPNSRWIGWSICPTKTFERKR
ncbi:hypothetical protein DDB_G0269478 [Dictyostelium discoideum AX4]|uniref:Uncharacterized protein n=1 Tax=Dictyostelium discoideum TaxID=44689 RepID=Q55DY4_DICDI|nr:hypothetical protein DDB_G0269478 [Dictyostelium discoideum AX4]EAL72089.1 hypothetical protein DDB_G0269478 [Dictyostelium discoideum AX4]|eukprot:XP_645997.1 hypothetical protein DDB_G0269478 [Dictyostelium discoideum AX4]